MAKPEPVVEEEIPPEEVEAEEEDVPERPEGEDPVLEDEMDVEAKDDAPAEPLSAGEERMVKTAMNAIANLLYKNPKVGKAAMELLRNPPHDKQIAQAVMMLIKHVKSKGIYIPEHLLTGIALKVLEMVMDLGMSVEMLPPEGDEELVQRAVEATLRAVAESAGVKSKDTFSKMQRERPVGAGLLE